MASKKKEGLPQVREADSPSEASPEDLKHSVPLVREATPTPDVPAEADHHMEVAGDGGTLKNLIPARTPPTPGDVAPDPEAEDRAGQTQVDLADLVRLEGIVTEGVRKHREATEALREIRLRDLYKVPGYFEDRPEGYSTFDEYVECRWGRTRNWVTQETNWLRACECLEANGKPRYQFSKSAIQCAAYLLECDPEGFCEVYLDAEAVRGLPVTEPAMRAALQRYEQFVVVRGEWERWQDAAQVPVADRIPLAREEASLVDFDWQRRSYSKNLVDEAKAKANETGGTWRDCLPEVCSEARMVPLPTHLLAAARGDDLKEVVLTLEPLLKQWSEQAKSGEELRNLEKQVKELRKKAGLGGKKGKTKANDDGKNNGSAPNNNAGGGPEGDGEGGDDGEVASPPPVEELLAALERSWATELPVDYLLRAGVLFWNVAFHRYEDADFEAKTAAVKDMKDLMGYLESA